MRKGEATRLRILEEAARQAAQKGLTGVSLMDVADAIGLSKSGLFKHFDSKEAMQLAVIDQVTTSFTDFVWRSAELLPCGRARLEAIFERWLDWGEIAWPDSGCPILALSLELDDQPGPVRDFLRQRLQQWRRTLVREFQALGDPPLTEAEAQDAYFQTNSFIFGHSHARRMLGDAGARSYARAAFAGVLDRATRKAA